MIKKRTRLKNEVYLFGKRQKAGGRLSDGEKNVPTNTFTV